MWHEDESERLWHDGDVSPWEWHWSTKAKRNSIDVLVVEEGVPTSAPFVVTVWLDIADEPYFEAPVAPSCGRDWPRSWRWVGMNDVLAAIPAPFLTRQHISS